VVRSFETSLTDFAIIAIYPYLGKHYLYARDTLILVLKSGHQKV